MFGDLQIRAAKWFSGFVAVLYLFFVGFPFGTELPERKCAPEFNGTFLQSWLSSSWDEERWADEVETMEKDGVKYLILQDLAHKDSAGSWSVYYDSDLDVMENASFGGDVLEAAFKAVKGSGIQIFVGLISFDNLWSGGTVTKEYEEICKVTADMMKEIYDTYYAGNEDNFYAWYFTPEFSNNIIMQLSTGNIIKGLNIVLDKASEIDPGIPLMMSPFMSNYYSVGKGAAAVQWLKIFTKANWRDGDIVAPQDAVGARWVDEDDLEDIWLMYYFAVNEAEVDLKLWANCENFTSAVAPSFGEGILNPEATENVVYVPVTLDRFARQMDIASRYCDNIISFSYTHYYSENQVSSAFIDTYLDYVEHGYTLEKESPVMGEMTKSQTDEGVELSWTQATDNIGISHYRIMKNGKFLWRAETFDGYHRVSYTDASGTMSDEYTIVAFDAAGNISQEVAAK